MGLYSFYPVKIALVGDPQVGKSCLIARFFTNEFSILPIIALGPSSDTKMVALNSHTFKMEVWDTPLPKFGSPSFT